MPADGLQSGAETGQPVDRLFRNFASGIARQRYLSIAWCTLLVTFVCLSSGWYLILRHSLGSVPGVLLLAEGMLLAAYLRHECAHLLVFKTKRRNMILAEILSWMTGDAQSPFAEYRQAHLRHHAEQVDLIGTDLRDLFQRYPGWARPAILIAEACYIPAVFFLVRIDDVSANLASATGRKRALGAVGFSAMIYITLITLNPISFVLYLAAVIIRIHCIRFADTFQHSYDRVASDAKNSHRGWMYEQQRTFSFPVLKQHRFLNFLLLNFGFHNAHHAVPNCPWYHLPKIDRALRRQVQAGQLFDTNFTMQETVGLAVLLRAYHRSRVNRILISETNTPFDMTDGFLSAALQGSFTDNLLG